MARSIKTNQDASGSEVGKTPVPTRWGSSAVIRCHESIVCRSEAKSVAGGDGEPNQVEDEVENDNAAGQPEDPLKIPSC
jgi:hypothetical protein